MLDVVDYRIIKEGEKVLGGMVWDGFLRFLLVGGNVCVWLSVVYWWDDWWDICGIFIF